MAYYVKFMRGTSDQFLRLANKDKDTLYFIYENEAAETGLLYLGSKLIAGGNSDLSTTSIDALQDVFIDEGLQNASLLIYDAVEGVWTNKTLDEALQSFVGANSTSAGKAGLVPAPGLGQTNLFLRSDGTWAPVETTGESSARVINIFNEQGASHDSILSQTEGQNHDLLIIHDPVGGTIPLHTPYVHDGSGWIPMSSSVTLAENVITADGYHLDDILNELTSKPDFNADNVSISIDNNILSLKDYGIKYYYFNRETNDYELQVVDAEHPWPAGLEARTVEVDGVVSLGWYEPNTTTVEGLETEISTLQDSVDVLQEAVDAKANSADVYTKLEVEEKIAAAAHLKRIEVEKLEDIDVDAPDADQYIYMVPSGLQDDDNKYYEYIVIEVNVYDEDTDSIIKAKRVERVGSWEVDLGDYAKTTEVNNALAGKVDKVDGSFLMTAAQAEKLESIQVGAQINAIEAVDGTFFILDETKKLGLKSLPVSQITNLETVLSTKVEKVDGFRLMSNTEGEKLNNLLGITAVSSDFVLVDGTLEFNINSANIATKNDVSALGERVANLESAIEWGNL